MVSERPAACEPLPLTVDESAALLYRLGYSAGDASFGPSWLVSASGPAGLILAPGATQRAAWAHAAELARRGRLERAPG